MPIEEARLALTSFDPSDFEQIAFSADCATCRRETQAAETQAGLPGVDAIYCLSLRELPHRAEAVAALFHTLGFCRAGKLYRPPRGRHSRHPPRDIWASHRAIACHALQNGFRRVAIFEDDVAIAISGGALRARVAKGLSDLPHDAWGMFLGHFPIQAYPVTRRVMRARSGCTHAYIANEGLLRWLARTLPMDVRVPVAGIGTSIDAAIANLPLMFALFPMIATQRFMGDLRNDRVFAAPGRKRKPIDPARIATWFLFHAMPLAEATALLLSPLHRLSLEYFRQRSGAALSRAAILIRASRLFDDAWYLGCNPDVAISGREPLEHYMRDGAREGRLPHPLFETSYYCRTYPQIGQSGENPLAHYLLHGASEGLNPNRLFDTAWYLEHNADVSATGLHPLVHYIEIGWRDGRPPHREFDPLKYLAFYPDVKAAGLEPLGHYLHHGAAEGRMIFAVE